MQTVALVLSVVFMLFTMALALYTFTRTRKAIEAAATAEEQAGVARIYAMEAEQHADGVRPTDPGQPPEISGVIRLDSRRVPT